MEVIALYPGQGSQKQGMGKSLFSASSAVRSLFALASEICNADLYAIATEGQQSELKRWAQPLITLVNISASIRAREAGIHMKAHAGFSLGELAAYRSAGIYDDQTLFAIVAYRSRLLQQESERIAAEVGELGMAAVLGLSAERTATLLQESDTKRLYTANDNAPKQVVLSGILAAIKEAEPRLRSGGAKRVVPLSVAGPFHTPLMTEAKEQFAAFLAPLAFADPHTPLYSSVTAQRVVSAAEAKRLLVTQLTHPVRWRECIATLDRFGIHFAEVGHGRVLCGLCRSNSTTTACISVGNESAIQVAIKEHTNAE